MDAAMILRVFDTAMEPDDIPRAQELFRDVVRPAFEQMEGCQGIEMYTGIGEHSLDLIDVAALSKWDSVEALEAALATPEYEAAVTELRTLFRETPIVRLFESAD